MGDQRREQRDCNMIKIKPIAFSTFNPVLAFSETVGVLYCFVRHTSIGHQAASAQFSRPIP